MASCCVWAAATRGYSSGWTASASRDGGQAAILFADLESSGVHSRHLSSRGYFDLIRDLTDLIDTSVIAHGGITGKHAGDGGSALFLAADFDVRVRGRAGGDRGGPGDSRRLRASSDLTTSRSR